MAYYVTVAIIFLWIHKVKEGMKNTKNQQELGAMEACMKKMVEAKKGLGHSNIKGDTMTFLLFLTHIGKLKLLWILVMVSLVC